MSHPYIPAIFLSLVLASISGAGPPSDAAAAPRSPVTPSPDENLLVYEPFDYDVGPLAGRVGGVGMVGPWVDDSEPGRAFVYDETTASQPVDTGAGLLSWDGVVKNMPTLPAAPAARFVGLESGGGEHFGSWRRLARNAGEMAGKEGVLWASIVWRQFDDHPGSHVAFALASHPFDDGGRKIKGAPANGDGVGSAMGVGGGLIPTLVTPAIFGKGIVQEITTRRSPSLRVGQANLLILKFVFGSYDSVFVHVFGEDVTPSLSEFNSKATAATEMVDESTLNVIAFSQTGGRNSIDEIRVGTTFTSVTRGTRDIPPPSVAAAVPDVSPVPVPVPAVPADVTAGVAAFPPARVVKASPEDDPDVVQVFILAGDTNLIGFGKSEQGNEDVPGAIGSLRYQVNHDPANYGHLVDTDGKWRIRDDVKVWWRHNELDKPPAKTTKGDLRFGHCQSLNPAWFGPEYGFGWVAGEHFPKSPVLIIKAAWLYKSLHTDFRPPSAVVARGGEVGLHYLALTGHVREVLANLGSEFPEFAGKSHRIAGIGLHLGMSDRNHASEHEANLADLIGDLRTEFGRPDLPFVIATDGTHPGNNLSRLELSQLAIADPEKHPRFAGTVRAVDTRPFKRDASISPSRFVHSWHHNGESMFLIGTSMGRAMMELLEPK